MPTRDQLLALNDELRRLKAGGQRAVAVTDESLAQLREAVAAETSAPAEPAAPVRAEAAVSYPPAPRAAPAPAAAAPRGPALPTPPPIKLPEGDKRTQWNHLRDLVLNDSVCRELLANDIELNTQGLLVWRDRHTSPG